ncbi:helix-turn-helix domain-containing protein [Rariglobus hedericola]|uniref:Helix-turn-helix domain-containing protein n=1 Tax=Rariglobus hedericola TaxID=2597822 RepID=A0A556QK34_9BACT|nr:helix-turn-helix domain-containing protein [Rariglobus hedericola]TSJ76981.1 helix-turn-helix domain-containing protein [Rariglobus hedericola]
MQTIGERLEEARKRKGISIREAAEATKIRGDYLHKYENNQFDIKLPEIYVRGFLRTYATYLKLSGDKIINDYHALGLGDAAKNGRAINREVYGRMDISVATAKAGNVGEAPSAAAAAMTPGADVVPNDKNPATFRPRAPGGLNLDPNLILKGSALVCGVIVLVLLLIWGIGALTGPKADKIPWVQPQAGERALGIVATANTELVSVTDSSGTVLYRGPVKAGETKLIPWNQALVLTTQTPQNIQIDHRGNRFPLKDVTTPMRAPKPNE